MSNGIKSRRPNHTTKLDEYRAIRAASWIDWYFPHQPKTKLQFTIEYFLNEVDEREEERINMVDTIHGYENGCIPNINRNAFVFHCVRCRKHSGTVDAFYDHLPTCVQPVRISQISQTSAQGPVCVHRSCQ